MCIRDRKKTSGSLALNGAPQVITIPPSDPVRVRKLRVAAYARVSSSSEDQLNSFAAQNAHYTELITANPEWECVDVYADVYKRQGVLFPLQRQVFLLKVGIVQAQDAVLNVVGGRPAHSEEGTPGQLKYLSLIHISWRDVLAGCQGLLDQIITQGV